MLLMAKAFGMEVGHSTRKFVLLKLADNANDKGEYFPSYQHIADHCEISRRSAINHIDALCEQGFVKKVYRKGEKGNSSNIYILNLDGENFALSSENSAPRTSHSFEPINEPKEKINKKEIQSKSVKTRFPENLIINESNQKLADELDLNAEFEFGKFRDRNLAIGGKYINWDSAFSGWLRKAYEYKHGGKKSTLTVQSKQSGMTPERQRKYERYLFINGIT